jgi:hypothetical protein
MEVAWIDTPEEWRDLLVMMYMAAGVITFTIIGMFSLLIGTLTFQIVLRVRRILRDNVQPAAVNVQGAAQNLKGTVEYVGDYAVKPVVSVYGVAAGARRFVSVFARLTRKEGQP